MSTELTTTQTLQGLSTVRAVLAPNLTDDELKLFAMVANRSGLDPFAKQVYAVKRAGRVTFQTSIDGYRSIAARTGLYDGQDEAEFGPLCDCGSKRPERHPEWATVRVYRKGVSRPIPATARWHEYVPEPGEKGQGDAMWRRMPHVMLGKVAEALALRKAFPYDPERHTGIGGDLYTAEEMEQADRPDPVHVAPAPTARERIAARREAISAPQPVVVYDAPLAAEAGTDDEPETVEGEVVVEAETAAADSEPDAPEPAPAGINRKEFNRLAIAGRATKGDVEDSAARLGLPVTDERTPEDWRLIAVDLGLL